MRLHHDIKGDGVPVFILHGLFGSLENWSAIARRLAQQFRVISLDLRNHGRSAHGPEMTYDLLASDLEETMLGLGVERAHIMGHSLGGRAAMRFAMQHPQRVLKLIAVDISPESYPPRHREILDALLSARLATCNSRHEINQQIAASIPDQAVRQFLLKNARRDAAGHYHWQLDLEAIRRNYDGLNEALPKNPPFDGPVLFIRGGASDYLVSNGAKEIQERFPRAEFVTIEGAGHWVHADAPDSFCAAVISFLQR